MSESKREKKEEKEVDDVHCADLCWCVLAVRAVEKGSTRSAKALIADKPVDLLYLCQNNVCVSVSLTSYLLVSPNKSAVSPTY